LHSAAVPSARPWRASAFTACAAVFGFLISIAGRSALGDGDTYWHLAAGDWILAHRAFPYRDPFSYTFAGQPWVAHEWLSEVLLSLAYRMAGWSGVLVLTGLAAALVSGALARYTVRWLDQPGALLLWLLGAACVGPSLLARPHLFALVPLTLWCIGLLSAKEQARAPSPWLLPLMVLWANLHGSFVLGLALLVPLAADALLAAPAARRRLAAGWAGFALAALAAALVTPHGVDGLLFPFKLMTMSVNQRIAEWQPTRFAKIGPAECALLALLYVLATRGVRIPLARLALLLGLIHLALAHERHQMVAGVVGALILAEPLGRAAGRTRPMPGSFTQAPQWLAAGLACIALAAGVRLAHPLQRGDDPVTPGTALDHVPAALRREPVLNSYDFGGYLIFRHVPPFVDGRADLYGDAFLSTYIDAMQGSRNAFDALVARYRVRWLLLDPHSAALPLVYPSAQWQRLYSDATAVVYARTGAQP
jgi:hypothetical protein